MFAEVTKSPYLCGNNQYGTVRLNFFTVLKTNSLVLGLALCGLGIASCIKEQAQNRECDIRKAEVHLPHPEDFFFLLNDTTAPILDDFGQSVIVFQGVKPTADLSRLTPTFTISKGATLFPPQGTLRDFSGEQAQTYFVIAEDEQELVQYPTTPEATLAYMQQLAQYAKAGRHIRPYQVKFSRNLIDLSDVISYDFEHYSLETQSGKYYEWSDPFNGQQRTVPNWATANKGFSTARGSAKPDEYPTVPVAEGGVDGGAYVRLTTSSTGEFGELFKMPLAAGNLFLGTFDFSVALTNTLQATRFGDNSILGRKPVRFTGYYQFSPGPQMTNQNGEKIPGTDQPAIYCVVYKNHDAAGRSVVLHGDDVEDSPLVVGKAEVKDWQTGLNGWVQFDLPFVWKEDIDPTRLDNHGYNFAIVCSSSKDGASYSGARGSILLVDKFRLIFE